MRSEVDENYRWVVQEIFLYIIHSSHVYYKKVLPALESFHNKTTQEQMEVWYDVAAFGAKEYQFEIKQSLPYGSSDLMAVANELYDYYREHLTPIWG